ncbi:MAG: hypothetical protein ACI9WS_001387 [Paraglaciecola psychrophila]|jgi:hypothetical protein
MSNTFSKNITQFVISELKLAAQARDSGNIIAEFRCLENAHVLGQESTCWHVKVHVLMFMWACRNFKPKELLGQAFRIVGAATKTTFGLVPQGNTGGANVSHFKVMPVKPEYEAIINSAKSGV